MNDLRVVRERLASADEALDSMRGDRAPHGSAALLARTTTVDTYPTAAASTYACIPQEIDGSEQEGAAATYVASGATFFAWNCGSEIPPSGTPIVVHAVGGRWVFRWD